MSGDYLSTQQQREQLCFNHSRQTTLTWFAGTAAVLGGGTYLAHLYYPPVTRINFRFKVIPVCMATLAVSYLRGEQALTQCRRQQLQLEYAEDMKDRKATWQARKQATHNASAATTAAHQTNTVDNHTARSQHQTVVPSTTEPAHISPSALGAALHDGSYERKQSQATNDKPTK